MSPGLDKYSYAPKEKVAATYITLSFTTLEIAYRQN
jgi:hypothetical protein